MAKRRQNALPLSAVIIALSPFILFAAALLLLLPAGPVFNVIFAPKPAFGAEAKAYREVYVGDASDAELRSAGEEARRELEKRGCGVTYLLTWRNTQDYRHWLIEARCIEWSDKPLPPPMPSPGYLDYDTV